MMICIKEISSSEAKKASAVMGDRAKANWGILFLSDRHIIHLRSSSSLISITVILIVINLITIIFTIVLSQPPSLSAYC